LEWVKPFLTDYDGLHQTNPVLKSVELRLQCSDTQLADVVSAVDSDVNSPLFLKKVHTPMLDSKLSFVGAFDTELQSLLVGLKVTVNGMNEEVDQFHFNFNQTFSSSLTAENRQVIRRNIDGNHFAFFDQSRRAIDIIARVLKK
jgi:shikimate kinase